MTSSIDQFKQEIASAGLPPPDVIFDDGVIHRFSTNGKSNDDAGWYILHTDGIPAGAFGCWRSGVHAPWCSKSYSAMTPAERDANQQRTNAMQAQRDADNAQRQQVAAKVAEDRWNDAKTCTNHAYLTLKGVQAHGVKVNASDDLLVPLRSAAGTLHSLQTITPEGIKRYLTDGRKKGCYHSIGAEPVDNTLIVCEGYATGASIHETTGHTVVVAFDSGNLEAVALAVRAENTDLKIIIAADDDRLTPGNPGVIKATAAAQAVGGYLAVPAFSGFERGDKDTDFNDLHKLAGDQASTAVKACIARAVLIGGTQETGDVWPEPTPLPNPLPPVDSFQAELLPLALRPWVMDIANRMQCPPDFSAVGAITVASSLIAARAVVQPKERDDWKVVPNLWGMCIGRPGVMKSPALGEAMKPLNRLEALERERAQAEHDAWEIDCKVAAMQDGANEKKAKKHIANGHMAAAREALEASGTPIEPTMRSYVENDATVEALGVILHANPWGLMTYRDELYGLLTSLDKPGQEGSRGFYLQAYDGNQGYKCSRIIRGITYVPRVCFSMLGGAQPGKIQRYVRDAVSGGSGDDGLLQRFGLTVWPDIAGEFKYVDQWPDTPAKQAAWEVFDRLANLKTASETDPEVWKFSPEAQALFIEWIVPFETEIRGDDLHPAMVSHLTKYRKLVPALALIFALIDTPDSGNVIHENELLRAIAWSEYLRSHANRLYAAASIPETAGAVALLSKLKGGNLVDKDGVILPSFAPREVSVKHWTGLATPESVRNAADLLVAYDYLRREAIRPGVTGGRPSDRYLINPALFKGSPT